jgi:hypothetical protein
MTNSTYECADCGTTLKHTSKCFIIKHENTKKHLKSISKPIEVIDLGYKVEYPTEYGRVEFINTVVKIEHAVQINFKVQLSLQEKGAIINALKFKFMVCMPNYLKDNDYDIIITKGIHYSNGRYHFNGFFVGKTDKQKKTDMLHFNLKNFKAENIPCISNITSINNYSL